MPELALGLLALGAIMAALLRRHPLPAYLISGLLGAAGIAAVLALTLPGLQHSVLGLSLPAESRALLVVSGITVAVIVALAPATVDRLALLTAGLAGLSGLALAAAVPDLAGLAITIALLGAGHAALPGMRPFADRMRSPGFAVALVGAGALLTQAGGPAVVDRLAALCLVLGLVAAAGLVPFLPKLEPTEPAPASPITWTGFFGPTLAVVLAARAAPLIAPGAIPVYGAALVGLGLLNLLWGSIGAWRVAGEVAAWRYSFLADWGLVLVGLGIVVHDGVAAAYLVLLSILLVRLPLYLWARPVLTGRAPKAMGPSNLLLAAALAGAAPFAGFSARVLLLRGATQLFWPLALVLGLSMLLWLAHSFRLARGIGQPQGRAAIGVVLALAASVILGLFPALALGAAGL
jgi:hypothetical protein